VPGHLPPRVGEYRRRMKHLALTYLTFNQNGTELLVNLSGEQIYLYDLSTLNASNPYVYNKFETLFPPDGKYF